MARIGPFKKHEENFECYTERLEAYFTANGVSADKQASVLISEMGAETYTLLKSLIPAPAKPKDKTYEELVTLLSGHFMPKPLIIAERFKFGTRMQDQNENVTNYAAELRRLSNTCEFPQVFLDEALRDKFVHGISHMPTQKNLLTKDNSLTFQKALETATAIEMAEGDAQRMKSQGDNGSANDVNSSTVGAIARKGQRNVKPKPKSGQSGKQKAQGAQQVLCYRCGKGPHNPSQCRYRNYKCHTCGKIGHLSSVCRSGDKSSNNSKPKPTNYVESSEPETESTTDMGMFTVQVDSVGDKYKDQPIKVKLSVDGQPLVLEVDTGSARTIIPVQVYNEQFSHIQLKECTDKLQTYSGDKLAVLGMFEAPVSYNGQCATLPIVVANVVNQPPILGRNWMDTIRLDWQSLFKVSSEGGQVSLRATCHKHTAVFQDGLGTMTPHKAKMHMKENAVPKFHKARPVPYALKPAVEAKLDELIAQGILVPVNYSEWASPLVLVPKADKSVRICGDYKVTINQYLDIDKYPLPTPQDLFATLSGGKYFTTLDLKNAYQQMIVDEDSRKYLTVNMSKGLFQYTRLPYGVASAPSIFQNAMDQILQGLEGVICYLDDILISGKDEAQHLERLDAVLSRLEKCGLKLKKAKCQFMTTEVVYLGHVITEQGIAATPMKVSAIVDAPQPRNVTELRSFLGMLNYYAKFIPDLATLIHPLNELLQSHRPFKWTSECDNAFNAAKAELLAETVLTHYDVTKPLRLACDASQYGIGAVLSHIMENGEERPVAFASRTLTASEKNYSQLQKEALSLVYGVQKFHKYIYGRHFTLITDHKPLLTILGPKSGVPTLAAARLQRWAIILSAYQYDIMFRSTGEHLNADALSRLPANVATAQDEESSIYHFTLLDELPVTAKEIETATRNDPVLSRVYQYTLSGWPSEIPDNLKAFANRKDELSVECGVVLWGLRVCIPYKLQARVLNELHSGHQGISRMKSLARGYFWWPKLDSDIETLAKGCHTCLSVKNNPAAAPLHPWKWATRRFERVHLDFAEKDGKNFLVLTDAYSKWLDVIIMPNITSKCLIEVLRPIIAAHGFPELFVTDNGPSFTSSEFAEFCSRNGIEHKFTPPYHPSSNGAAERSVQNLKQALRTSQDSGLTLQHRVANFLLIYRNTPHTTTGCTPAELFLNCKPRIRLSLLKPSLSKKVKQKQDQMKSSHDGKQNKVRAFEPGDSVMVRNFRGSQKWKPGTIMQRLGPILYMVKVQDSMRHVHVDHLIRGSGHSQNRSAKVTKPPVTDFVIPSTDEVQQPVIAQPQHNQQQAPVAPAQNRRYPVRNRKPPQRLDL